MGAWLIPSPLLSPHAGCLFLVISSRTRAPRLRRRRSPARYVAARQPCAPRLRRALVALFVLRGSMRAKKAPSRGKGFHKKKPPASLVSPFFAVLRETAAEHKGMARKLPLEVAIASFIGGLALAVLSQARVNQERTAKGYAHRGSLIKVRPRPNPKEIEKRAGADARPDTLGAGFSPPRRESLSCLVAGPLSRGPPALCHGEFSLGFPRSSPLRERRGRNAQPPLRVCAFLDEGAPRLSRSKKQTAARKNARAQTRAGFLAVSAKKRGLHLVG